MMDNIARPHVLPDGAMNKRRTFVFALSRTGLLGAECGWNGGSGERDPENAYSILGTARVTAISTPFLRL